MNVSSKKITTAKIGDRFHWTFRRTLLHGSFEHFHLEQNQAFNLASSRLAEAYSSLPARKSDIENRQFGQVQALPVVGAYSPLPAGESDIEIRRFGQIRALPVATEIV